MNTYNKPTYKKLTTSTAYEKEQINELMKIFKLDNDDRYSYSLSSIMGDTNNSFIITLFYKGIIQIQIKYNNSNRCNKIRCYPSHKNDVMTFEDAELDSILERCTTLYNYIHG